MDQCCECKEDIKNGATRCPHCSAVQGWRRLLRTPLIICGFILTIVSILAADPVKRFTDPKRADIQPSIIGGDYLRTKIMLTNMGTRAATLVKIKIDGETKQGHTGTWYLKSNLDGELLEPGKSYVTEASNGDVIPGFVERLRSTPLKHIYGATDNCRLLIDYVEVNGKEFTLSYPFMCDPVDIGARGGLYKSTQ